MRAVLRWGLVLAIIVGLGWLLVRAADAGFFDAGGGGAAGGDAAQSGSAAFPEPTPEEVQAARERLDAIPTGYGGAGGSYDRNRFGRGWADLDRDGCLTRNEILQRDLTDTSLHANGCVVGSGTLVDPYSGVTIHFRHGAESSQAVQIDHIVPLGYAWRQGAWRWSAPERLRFANDPRNLVAVDGRLNDDKGSDGPGRWMPPNAAVHCGYAVAFVTLLDDYGLDAFPADERELRRTLDRC